METKQEKTQEQLLAEAYVIWDKVLKFCSGVLGMWMFLILMPFLLIGLFPSVATCLVVRLWWMWLLLLAYGGMNANNIRNNERLRIWLSTAATAPAILICPIALYHWATPYVSSLVDLCA